MEEPDKKRFSFKTLLTFLGPGFLVTVGFVDPGNWATNIEGGATFGYKLLWVVTLGTLMLVIIQHLAAKLGIATGKSLAVNIRDHFPKPVTAFLGFTVIFACIATDVAELLGGSIGLSLLFGMPLWIGALLTLSIKIFLVISQRYHRIETIIIGFLGIITLCYIAELVIVKPDWVAIAPSFVVPNVSHQSIYIAMAILGALVMPHNIFLHSNIIHSRQWGISEAEKWNLLRYEKMDTLLAMTLGWVVNASMMIVAATVFFQNNISVTSIEQASATLKPFAGHFAGLLFALALTFSGIGASITSSMAEADVVTGFMGKPEDPRSTFYRLSVFVTALPAFFIILFSEQNYRILIFSQVILSIQLPFTLLPLLILSRNKQLMGEFRSRTVEFMAAAIISMIVIVLNIYFLYTTLTKGS